jgi:transcriptional regulator with XRE-family HTH domain
VVASSVSVTAVKWWFAAEMRRMREKRGLTREQAAAAVRGSVANIGHIETARGLPKPLELERLLELYGEPERVEFFQDLRLRAKRGRDWWVGFRETVPGYLHLLLGLEASAVQIESWDAHVVPGLFQTHATADAMIRVGRPDLDDDGINRLVELRMSRQREVIDREEPPALWSVIAESALRWPVGGTDAHRAQLERLIELAARPSVDIQILPFSVGAHLGTEGPFRILSAPPELENYPGCVVVEDRVGVRYYDEPTPLMTYRNDLSRLRVQALKPEESVAHLHQLLKEP